MKSNPGGIDTDKLGNKTNRFNEGEIDFRKNFDDFIKRWEKEAKYIRDRKLTEDDAQDIRLRFENENSKIIFVSPSEFFTDSDSLKLESVKSKLIVSLKIATSNYQSEHKTLTERLIDNIGGIFSFLRPR